jgi:hypothetical protein
MYMAGKLKKEQLKNHVAAAHAVGVLSVLEMTINTQQNMAPVRNLFITFMA